ncbi:hypothetical protein ABTB62_19825, partial [Acinetobacter baumannii]
AVRGVEFAVCLCTGFARPSNSRLSGRSIDGFEGSVERSFNDRQILSALIAFNRMAGDATAALGYAERLAVITPGDPGLARLIEEL